MPRKKVNGNIIGASMQNIRLCGEIIAVNRRTGGLEICHDVEAIDLTVNRRIGGLEKRYSQCSLGFYVNRRIGGLEKRTYPSCCQYRVNRRIGGLESIYSGQWGA